MTTLLIATGIASLQSWPSSQHCVGPSVSSSIPWSQERLQAQDIGLDSFFSK